MIVAAVLLLAAQMHPPDEQAWESLKVRIETAPQEIATFIERRTGCNHFDGEAGSEYPEREQMVQSARKQLRCDEVEADERGLRKAYGNRPDVLKLLEDTKHLMPW